MRCSVVIPVHNEGAGLESLLTQFVEGLPPPIAPLVTEILVVENGSTDITWHAALTLQHRFPGLVRALSIPCGSYGEAIKHGIVQSRGTHVSILECDLLDAGFLAESIRLFHAEEAEFVVASKRHRLSIDHRPFRRRFMTAGFNMLLRALVKHPGTDTHGLKSIEIQLAQRLCDLAMTTDEVFQTEIVLLAWRLGCRVVEVPIKIDEVRTTPVAILRRVPKVIPILWQLRQSLARFPSGQGQDSTQQQVRGP
jgi:glycosyltransferase involved in cell wall biosynthesis